MSSPNVISPVQRLMISTAIASALRLVVNEAYAARQPWPRLGGDECAWIAQEVLQSFGTKAPGGTCFGAT